MNYLGTTKDLIGRRASVYGESAPKSFGFQAHARVPVVITKVRGERLTVRDEEGGYVFTVGSDDIVQLKSADGAVEPH